MSTGSTHPNLSVFPSHGSLTHGVQPWWSSSVPRGGVQALGVDRGCWKLWICVCSTRSSSATSSNQGNLMVPE